jgi:hypothetical protein
MFYNKASRIVDDTGLTEQQKRILRIAQEADRNAMLDGRMPVAQFKLQDEWAARKRAAEDQALLKGAAGATLTPEQLTMLAEGGRTVPTELVRPQASTGVDLNDAQRQLLAPAIQKYADPTAAYTPSRPSPDTIRMLNAEGVDTTGIAPKYERDKIYDTATGRERVAAIDMTDPTNVVNVGGVKAQELPSEIDAVEYLTGQKLAGAGQAGMDMVGGYNQSKAARTNVNVNTGTVGEDEFDKTAAKELAAYTIGGGFSDVQKQLGQLGQVLTNLESSDDITGWFVGSLPESVAPIIAPQAVANRDLVEEVVQRNLRLILGAQFTEKEGERLIKRAYNPKLSEQENARRVANLIKQIHQAAKAKQDAADYFRENRTLRGWGGQLPRITDFYEAVDPVEEPTVKQGRGFKVLGVE